jgi:hypothetical protein
VGATQLAEYQDRTDGRVLLGNLSGGLVSRQPALLVQSDSEPLLPQPGGFESLLGLGEHPHRENLAIAERPQVSIPDLDLGAALVKPRPDFEDHRYLVAAFNEFLGPACTVSKAVNQPSKYP